MEAFPLADRELRQQNSGIDKKRAKYYEFRFMYQHNANGNQRDHTGNCQAVSLIKQIGQEASKKITFERIFASPKASGMPD